MSARDSDDGQIQFDKLGGLNERPAPSATPAPDFTKVHALYQRHAGALQRLEGTKTFAYLPDGIGVLGLNQLDDSTGSLIVQSEDGTEYLYTLNELFGRTVVSSLVYTPLQDDNNMPTAILIQDAANGTDLADIGGASSNTQYTRPLTSNPINESTIVAVFTSGASATFEIAAGTYRIRGYVTASAQVTVGAGTGTATGSAGFQCALVDTTTSTTVATGIPAWFRAALTAGNTSGAVNILSVIDDTFTIAGPANSVMQLKNGFTSAVSATGSATATVTVTGGNASDVSAVLNGAALRQPYVKLTLAKVA